MTHSQHRYKYSVGVCIELLHYWLCFINYGRWPPQRHHSPVAERETSHRRAAQPQADWHRLCRVTWFLFFNDLNQSNIDANDHGDMMARQPQHSVLILLLFHTSYCIYLAGFLLLNQFWIIMKHNLNADVIIKLISDKKTVGSISSTILIQTE